jgi:phage RecT family recombinase
MSTALQERQETGGGLVAWIDRPEVHNRLASAVGDVMNADQFIAHMLTAFQSPDVRQCSDRSKFTALHECAALGLLPTLNQVRLIPYKDQLKAMPQWQGYKALMERHPDILEVQAFLVHVNDSFAIENGEPKHGFDPFNPEREFKSVADVRGGYLRILYRNGRPPKYHYVTAQQIRKAQACAQTQNVWKNWYEQMALKTIYRDAYARRAVPVDPLVYARLQAATKADDLVLGNDPQQAEGTAAEVYVSKSARLAADLGGRGCQEESNPPAADTGPEAAPEREPGEDDEPSAVDAEAVTVSDWIRDLGELIEIRQCQDALKAIPAAWSAENRQKAANAVEMREAEIRGKRGQRSNSTMFESGPSATEQGQ